MSGRSVAIWLWQIMQVFTLGIPAIGPFSTLSWQSVHTAFLAMCVLCGNGIGCVAFGWISKKCRAASTVDRCASVKTAGSGAGPALHAAAAHTTSAITAFRQPIITSLADYAGS